MGFFSTPRVETENTVLKIQCLVLEARRPWLLSSPNTRRNVNTGRRRTKIETPFVGACPCCGVVICRLELFRLILNPRLLCTLTLLYCRLSKLTRWLPSAPALFIDFNTRRNWFIPLCKSVEVVSKFFFNLKVWVVKVEFVIIERKCCGGNSRWFTKLILKIF